MDKTESKPVLEVCVAATFLQKLFGLIPFQAEKRIEAPPMLFSPCRSIHTFFMRRKIDVAFLDEEGRVIKVKRNLSPCRVTSCVKARVCLERFSNPLPWLALNQQPLFYEISQGTDGLAKERAFLGNELDNDIRSRHLIDFSLGKSPSVLKRRIGDRGQSFLGEECLVTRNDDVWKRAQPGDN